MTQNCLVFIRESPCMSHYPCYMTRMARGESGRIVIEIEPEVKRRLYAALALSGSTLKDWFVKSASAFCSDAVQPSLFDRRPKTSEAPITPARSDSPLQQPGQESRVGKRLRTTPSEET